MFLSTIYVKEPRKEKKKQKKKKKPHKSRCFVLRNLAAVVSENTQFLQWHINTKFLSLWKHDTFSSDDSLCTGTLSD